MEWRDHLSKSSSATVPLEIVFLPEGGLCLIVLMGEESFPARAEVDVPAPETALEGLGILVVRCAELAVLAGVGLLFHDDDS